MEFFNFNLPSLKPQATKVLVCPKCRHQFEWAIQKLGNTMVGIAQPPCPRCGFKECEDLYARTSEGL